MFRSEFPEALELGANKVTCCRNGWWRVYFICADTAQFFRAYAEEAGWRIIGSGHVFGVRPIQEVEMSNIITLVRSDIQGAMEMFPRGTPRSAVSGAYHAGLLGRTEYKRAEDLLAHEHECSHCEYLWFPKNTSLGAVPWQCPVCGEDGLAN